MVDIIVPDLDPTPLAPIGCVIDGGGNTLTTGYKRAPLTVSQNCTITGWRIIGDLSGSIEMDIYRAAGIGGYPPGVGDSIIDADPPVVVAAVTAESTDVSAWCGGTAQLDDGDILEFFIVSVLNFKQIRIELFRESR